MKRFLGKSLCMMVVATLSLSAASSVWARESEEHEEKEVKETKKERKTFKREYGMAGCGLGSVIVGRQGGQIFAATTNGTLYNQSFGISFGTLNCDDSEMAQTANRMDVYVSANKVALASDIARGGGEALVGVSKILKCSDPELLSSKLQGNFAKIFPSYEITPNEVTDSMITVILQDSKLSKTCSFLQV